ncbi:MULTISPECIES: META domain-containing protein [Marinobacter]|uniref:META domain-containing protein n=1 Tax=Marinobacter metalliresistant TaxID=2961995 RepID=A0ABZ2VX31_9GAMM|nr:META domain-containing protein [Marinobacter sp. Arc7-DN-1]
MYSGRVLMLSVVTASGLAATACSSLPEGSKRASGVYSCGQLEIGVSGTEDSKLISVDYLDRRILLKPAESASGALYVAPGDETTRFWNKGERATLTIQGQTYPECLPPGGLEMPFEARGNEPFWHVTIEGQELLLTRPYEEERTRRIPVALQTANRHGREFVATLDDLSITLTVAQQLCEDSMSGAQYPAQVRLAVNGGEFSGCGGDPQRLFRGAEWVVENLAGSGIIDRSQITIEFLEDNRIAGRSSCNRYTGSYKLGGEGIAFGPMAITRMACAPVLMRQEDRFLNLLGRVASAKIGRKGELRLSTPEGDTIRAFHSGHVSP